MQVLSDVGSDHLPVLVTVNLRKTVSDPKDPKRWIFSKACWDKYRQATDNALESVQVDCSRNVDSAYGEFIRAIQGAARRTITRSYAKRKFKPFWTSALERLVRQRKAARRRAIRRKTAESRREYNRLTTEVRRAVLEAKMT